VNPLSYLRRWVRPVQDGPVVVALGGGPEGMVAVPTELDVTGEPCGWVWCAPGAAEQWDVRLWKGQP
jgi:hypothetical protein